MYICIYVYPSQSELFHFEVWLMSSNSHLDHREDYFIVLGS